MKKCPAKNCLSMFHTGTTVRAIEFIDGNAHGGNNGILVGTKIYNIIDTILNIRWAAANDRIVIFVQHREIRKQLLEALDRNKISSLGGRDAASIGEAIEGFKDHKARVLVLDLNDVQASGANLTVANHVMFVSPLLEEDDYVLQRNHATGPGRCLRRGQRKKVYLYHFYSEVTIDQSILDKKLPASRS